MGDVNVKDIPEEDEAAEAAKVEPDIEHDDDESSSSSTSDDENEGVGNA